MDNEMFVHQVEALRDEYRVLTWDERGFGSTTTDGKPFDYWDSARDCLGVLDHLGIDHAVLGGMSQGGYLSMRAALLEPKRVSALILLDTQAAPDKEESRAGNQGMVDMWLQVGPVDDLANAVAAIIIDDQDESPKLIAKWQARDKDLMELPTKCLMDRDDISGRLGEITCPALVIHGTEDTAITMEAAEQMADSLPDCDGVVKVSGTHAANVTNPGPVNKEILEFLADLPA
jgi:3-oxoadipate enol-lactonase